MSEESVRSKVSIDSRSEVVNTRSFPSLISSNALFISFALLSFSATIALDNLDKISCALILISVSVLSVEKYSLSASKERYNGVLPHTITSSWFLSSYSCLSSVDNVIHINV